MKQKEIFSGYNTRVGYYGIFSFNLGQSFEVYNTSYVMYSFDAALAVLGGYAALTWQIMAILLGWHQDLSYSNALGLELFTRDKTVVK